MLSAALEQTGVLVDSVPDDDWHRALSQFADVHYEQTACFSAGQRGEAASHLLLGSADAPIGGARVALYQLPVLGNGLALVRFGPFWRKRDRSPDWSAYERVIQALIEEYCGRRGLCLTIRPRPQPDFIDLECGRLENLGFRMHRIQGQRFLVDLSLDDETQLRNFEQGWRYRLRKALKHQFDIGPAPESDFAAFRKMYSEMVARKRLNYSGLNLVDVVPALARLPDALKIHLIVVRHADKPVAGAAVGILGDTAYYVFGATAGEGPALNAGYAIQWWILRWLRERHGIRWYELGGTGDAGIRRFKKGLIGKRGRVLDTPEFHFWSKTSARITADCIFAIRDARALAQQSVRWFVSHLNPRTG